MSAKGRVRGRGRVDAETPALFDGQVAASAPAKDTGEEFYPTPRDAILALLETDLVQLPGGNWIEPCAGTGRIISTVNEYRSDVRWHAFEIDPRLGSVLTTAIRPGLDVLAPFGDFVHRSWPYPPAAAMVFNPPFSLAMDFVLAGFERARWVAMLQRSNWFAPARSNWLREHCPDVYPLAKRPSFTPDGKTDSTEYSWFVWPPDGRDRRSGRVAMLEPARGGQRDLFASTLTTEAP